MTLKILVVDDEEDIRDIIAFTFETFVEADFLFAGSGNSAFDIIKKHNDIDLVISDYNMPDGNGGDLYLKMQEANIQTPYALCSSVLLDEVKVYKSRKNIIGQIVKPSIYEGVEEILKKMKESKKELSMTDEGYRPIKISMLKVFSEAPSDIFLKINEKKYVKVFNENSAIEISEIQKYEQKDLEYLYVFKEDAKVFVDKLIDTYFDIMQVISHENDEKVFDVHDVLIEILNEYGLSEKVISLAKRSVEYAIDIFNKTEKGEKLLKKVLGYKKEYLTKHSILLAYINCSIIDHLPWNTPENKDKLVMASFIHDATIKDSRFVEVGVPANEINFKDHPYEASKLIRSFSDIPCDVDKIIVEHHERPDGNGIPRGLTASQLAPLSTVFIFSHDVVDIIFELNKDSLPLTKKLVLKRLDKDYYTCGHFAKCFEAVLKMEVFKDD